MLGFPFTANVKRIQPRILETITPWRYNSVEVMVMNDRFNQVLKRSGLSMYAVSRMSGVPYTTVNEIHNKKIDINQCASGTLFRLASALNVKPDEIINPIRYMDGTTGRYQGITYTWSYDNGSQITFQYDGKQVTLNTGRDYNIPGRNRIYNQCAEWMIQDYIDEEKWQKEAERILAGRKQ